MKQNIQLCCNRQHLHKGRVWGMRVFPVLICCACSEAFAQWNNPFTDILLFIGSMFNHEEEFAIELPDNHRTPKP